jgi:membrane protease YdiL (CAAX protease family)
VLVLAIAVVNAVAEERFFRGALPVALVGDHRAVVATAVYVLVTVATLNVALVVAAAAMGTVFMLERLATRGILAPTLTHLTWSTLMLLAIPR